MGGKHKKKAGGLSVIWMGRNRSHKYRTIHNRQPNHHYQHSRIRNISGSHNAGFSDMMSGDSTLPLSSKHDESKTDIPLSTAAALTVTTDIENETEPTTVTTETAAALVDHKKVDQPVKIDVTITENEPLTSEKDTLNHINASHTNSNDDNKPDQLLITGNSDKIDGVWKTNDIKKMHDDTYESAADNNDDEEECVVKCLYYTIQCCECAIQ